MVISQLYVGGGSGDAPLNADFVELFNRGGDPVSLGGWSVQYASAEGTTGNPAALTGTLQPGAFYLVSGPVGTAGAVLPTPDATGLPAMSADTGRVALVSQTTVLGCGKNPACATSAGVIDFVGYGGKAVGWLEGRRALTGGRHGPPPHGDRVCREPRQRRRLRLCLPALPASWLVNLGSGFFNRLHSYWKNILPDPRFSPAEDGNLPWL